jgi:hypothetical protein
LIPPTVPEVRRLIRAMRGPEQKREFRLGWSLFRRAHQAVAKRCHKASHREKHNATDHRLIEQDARRRSGSDPTDPGEGTAPKIPAHAKEAQLLADAEWELVRALLPRQEPGQGRPRRDDRQVLCGGYCGSWTEALRGGIYRKRSLGPTVRSTAGTASGAKKGSGLR